MPMPEPTAAALSDCLRAPTGVDEITDVQAWMARWVPLATRGLPPMALALRGGHAADRLGWAFAAGYQAALRALVPTLPADALAAFCVTEEGGNRPRDIRTTLAPLPGGGYTLNGAKRWTTLGPQGAILLVTARLGGADDEARPRLKVARVRTGQPGVVVTPMPPTPFVPEVPHARVALTDVAITEDDLLPGDGYTRCVKPFRTLEDLYVAAAVLAWLAGTAHRRGWPQDFREGLAGALALLAALDDEPPDAPATHLALAGALQWATELHRQADALWARAPDDPAAQRWQRDRPLMNVAATARRLRAERAWEAFDGPAATH